MSSNNTLVMRTLRAAQNGSVDAIERLTTMMRTLPLFEEIVEGLLPILAKYTVEDTPVFNPPSPEVEIASAVFRTITHGLWKHIPPTKPSKPVMQRLAPSMKLVFARNWDGFVKWYIILTDRVCDARITVGDSINRWEDVKVADSFIYDLYDTMQRFTLAYHNLFIFHTENSGSANHVRASMRIWAAAITYMRTNLPASAEDRAYLLLGTAGATKFYARSSDKLMKVGQIDIQAAVLPLPQIRPAFLKAFQTIIKENMMIGASFRVLCSTFMEAIIVASTNDMLPLSPLYKEEFITCFMTHMRFHLFRYPLTHGRNHESLEAIMHDVDRMLVRLLLPHGGQIDHAVIARALQLGLLQCLERMRFFGQCGCRSQTCAWSILNETSHDKWKIGQGLLQGLSNTVHQWRRSSLRQLKGGLEGMRRNIELYESDPDVKMRPIVWEDWNIYIRQLNHGLLMWKSFKQSTPKICSAPDCDSPTELISSLKRCKGCEVKMYCSSACQSDHWVKAHSSECGALSLQDVGCKFSTHATSIDDAFSRWFQTLGKDDPLMRPVEEFQLYMNQNG